MEIAPNVEHWHGAAPDSWFAHLAISCNPKTNVVTWLNQVETAEYLATTNEDMNRYTEENKELNARQQAIVAIASYTGKGDLEHLRQALVQGLEAGMTVNEIKEVLIQAYAYCGFPRSLRATACQYCMPCPYIPAIFGHYNRCINEGNVPASAQDENYRRARRAFLVGYDRSVPKLRQADHCIGCGQCEPHCPQNIKIPEQLRRIDDFVEQLKRGTL